MAELDSHSWVWEGDLQALELRFDDGSSVRLHARNETPMVMALPARAWIQANPDWVKERFDHHAKGDPINVDKVVWHLRGLVNGHQGVSAEKKNQWLAALSDIGTTFYDHELARGWWK